MAEDLLAFDFTDELVDSPNNRRDRSQRAFEDSKSSYAREPISLSPAWFQISHGELASFVPEKDMKVLEFSLYRLYHQKKYREALDACVKVIDCVMAADAPGNRTSSHTRELLDLGMRCCIKLSDSEVGMTLAEKSRDKWTTSSGCAATAAHLYLMMGHPKGKTAHSRTFPRAYSSLDAIVASLSALRQNVQIYSYIMLLADSFMAWSRDLERVDGTPSFVTARSLGSLIGIAGHKTFLRHGGISKFQESSTQPVARQTRKPHDFSDTTEESLKALITECCFENTEAQQLLDICSFATGAKSVETEHAGEEVAMRTVREL